MRYFTLRRHMHLFIAKAHLLPGLFLCANNLVRALLPEPLYIEVAYRCILLSFASSNNGRRARAAE